MLLYIIKVISCQYLQICRKNILQQNTTPFPAVPVHSTSLRHTWCTEGIQVGSSGSSGRAAVEVMSSGGSQWTLQDLNLSEAKLRNRTVRAGLWQVRVGIFQLTLTALLGSLVMIFAYFRHLCAQSMWILRIRNLQIHWLNSDTKASWLSITHFWSHSFRHP